MRCRKMHKNNETNLLGIYKMTEDGAIAVDKLLD